MARNDQCHAKRGPDDLGTGDPSSEHPVPGSPVAPLYQYAAVQRIQSCRMPGDLPHWATDHVPQVTAEVLQNDEPPITHLQNQLRLPGAWSNPPDPRVGYNGSRVVSRRTRG